MEHLIDLDELVDRLRTAADQWRAHAEVGPFTWRDERAEWPQPIVTDRASVAVPESLGFWLHQDADREIHIVIWTGGWADVDTMEGALPTPDFRDVDGAVAAIVAIVDDFLA
ncbi:hypothetical protein [Amycolatopsis sp. 195334CR]|uniref:hypothetical protein n=1 Tax=Amycolatopsis sp. 195334CR TaxID=2814588 RepID=UPI001A8C139B|nr:hypothetical protein [Amycolatopsis sp. 195334CR]MBN6035869.1 hypothetical protein [Amycolatopsis sp. 195334CR]